MVATMTSFLIVTIKSTINPSNFKSAVPDILSLFEYCCLGPPGVQQAGGGGGGAQVGGAGANQTQEWIYYIWIHF